MAPARESGQESLPVGRLVRMAWLAVLVTVVHFWSQRHLGVSLVTGLTGSVVVTTIISFFGGLRADLLSKKQEKQVQKWTGRIWKQTLEFATSPRFLVTGTFVVFFAGSTFSSVQITATGPEPEIALTITPEAREPVGKATADPLKIRVDETKICLLPTTLFGRRYVVSIAGYRPYAFDLPPWSGATLRIPESLQQNPTVLVRVPARVTNNLATGQLRLERIDASGVATNLIEPQKLTDDERAVLVGDMTSVPTSSRSTWTLELAASELDATNQARQLLGWQNPRHVSVPGGLAPGIKLRASFVAANGQILASAEFTVSADSFQDIVLINNPPPH